MPRPRKPLALAKVEGRDKTHKSRYSGRNEPKGIGPIGDPPPHIQDVDGCLTRTAWIRFTIEIPWLQEADTSLLEMASLIRGEILAGGVPGIQRINALRMMLAQMGATPADRTKIGVGGDDDTDEDDDWFLNAG
jgi:phage terminase small subunit